MANNLSSGLVSSVFSNIAAIVEGAMRSPIPVNASITADNERNFFFMCDLFKHPSSSHRMIAVTKCEEQKKIKRIIKFNPLLFQLHRPPFFQQDSLFRPGL
jgi:hypothetical protein